MSQSELIVRALIIDGNKILLCENKKGHHYFLPGGHVEFGEGFKNALIRETKEELGVSGTVGEMVGVLENIYKGEDTIHHEVNIIFSASIPTTEIFSQENHIAFCWVELEDLPKINLLPKKFIELVPKWFKNKDIFFESNLS